MRRGKRNCTLRFKPDLWGRVPESEGTVLFDGTVTMAFDSDQGAYGGMISLAMPEEDFDIKLILNGETFTGTLTQGEVFFLVDDDPVCGIMVQSESEVDIFGVSPYTKDGENSVKIIQVEEA